MMEKMMDRLLRAVGEGDSLESAEYVSKVYVGSGRLEIMGQEDGSIVVGKFNHSHSKEPYAIRNFSARTKFTSTGSVGI